MPSREHELDYADDPLSLRNCRRSNNVLILLIIGSIALVLLLGVGVIAVRLMLARQAEAAAAKQAAIANASAANLYNRDDLKAEIFAAGEDAVTSRLGHPVKTSEDGETKLLYYRNLTIDPLTGKVDALIAIELVRGRVVAVNFNP
jgi:hypothetical protein